MASISIAVASYQVDLRSRVSGKDPQEYWRAEQRSRACSVVLISSSHRGESPRSGRCQFGWLRRVKTADSFVEGETGKSATNLRAQVGVGPLEYEVVRRVALGSEFFAAAPASSLPMMPV